MKMQFLELKKRLYIYDEVSISPQDNFTLFFFFYSSKLIDDPFSLASFIRVHFNFNFLWETRETIGMFNCIFSNELQCKK